MPRKISRLRRNSKEAIRNIIQRKPSVSPKEQMIRQNNVTQPQTRSQEKVAQNSADNRKRFRRISTALKEHAINALGRPKKENTKTQRQEARSKDLGAWIADIGKYDLAKIEKDNKLEISQVSKYLSPEAQEKLYADTVETSPTSAREKLLDHLYKVLNDGKDHKEPTKPVNMKALLGSKGLELYKAAIKEERESKAFRDAVFLASTQKYPGDTWNQKLVLHVGGPSACGKTYTSGQLVEKMGKELMQSDQKEMGRKNGNIVVAVDGGVERDISQMRQILLQVALKKGYPGIEDLHTNTKLGIKSKIKAAAKLEKNLHMVIPNTFTSTIGNPIPGSGDKVEKEMKEFDTNSDVVQVFSIVEGSKNPQIGQDKNSTFQKQVGVMGSSRAWYRGTPDKLEEIGMNQKAPCESKTYEGQHFQRGVDASRKAKAFFESKCANSYSITYHNHLMHLKKVDDQWQVCAPKDPFDAKSKDFTRIDARDAKINDKKVVKFERQKRPPDTHWDKLPHQLSVEEKRFNEAVIKRLDKLKEQMNTSFSSSKASKFFNASRQQSLANNILNKIMDECHYRNNVNKVIDLDEIVGHVQRASFNAYPKEFEKALKTEPFKKLEKQCREFIAIVEEKEPSLESTQKRSPKMR